MSYTPTNWQTGDTITAEKLNNMQPLPASSASEAGALVMIDGDTGDYTKEGLFQYNRKVTIDCEIDAQTGEITTISTISLNDAFRLLTGSAFLLCNFSLTGITHSVVMELIQADFENSYYAVFAGTFYDPVTHIGRPFSCLISGDITFEWLDKPFLVTLTPTAQDFSGTMDKDPSDINTAIANGMRIMFSIPSLSASVEATQFVGGSVACANITYDIGGQDVLIQIVTSASDSTYSTKIFPLTPMS